MHQPRPTVPSFLKSPSQPLTTNSKLSFELTHLLGHRPALIRKSEYVSPHELTIDKKIEVENGYQCSVLDYGASLRLVSEAVEQTSDYSFEKSDPETICEYGPVRVSEDLKKASQLEHKSFKVGVILNKTQTHEAECRVLKSNEKEEKVMLFFMMQEHLTFTIDFKAKSLRANFLQCINVDQDQPNLLRISIIENRKKFIGFLSVLKIYCHFGNSLKLYFQDQLHLNVFLLKILEQIDSPIPRLIKDIKSIENSTSSGFLSSIEDSKAFGVDFLPTEVREKVHEIQRNYRRMQVENQQLKQENSLLRKKLLKCGHCDQSQKIKQIQKNMRKMKTRIDILEIGSKKKTMFPSKKHRDVSLSSSRTKIQLLRRRSPKLADRLKLFPPTPKYFKTEWSSFDGSESWR